MKTLNELNPQVPPIESQADTAVVISADEFQQLSTLGNVIIADVRWYLDGRDARKVYTEGHIPGAIFVDLEKDLVNSDRTDATAGRHPFPSPSAFAGAMSRLGISNTSRVIAYDDTGGMTAARFVVMLRMLGCQASLLDGGIAAWQAHSHEPLATGKPMSVKGGTFTTTPWPVHQLASKQELEEILIRTATSSRLVILDARSPDRFAGNVNEAAAKLDPQPGHVPGAFNAPWNSLLDSQTGILKNVDELRVHYESLCVDVADDVIAYCGSGISACLNVVALEHAGFGHARLFVASWSGWASDPQAPIEVGSATPDRDAFIKHTSSVSSHAVRELRRTRQKNRLAEVEWFEALYRVYLAAFIFGGGILFLSGLVTDEPVTTTTAADVLKFGPSWLGLAGVLALAMGLRSGSRGGPLAIEEADVRHVLLAPVSRQRVLMRPAVQRLRTVMFSTAAAGAVAGQLAGRRLPGTAMAWALSGSIWGATAGALFVGAALCAHSLKLRGWMASIVGAALLVWQVTASLPKSTLAGPGDLQGGLAMWGQRTRSIEIAPILAAALLMIIGLVLLGRQSLESLSRRSALVSQLRFAVTLQDLRTVTLLRRQLSQERSRSRPWLKVRRNRGFSTEWHRGWQGLLRFPVSRLTRIVSLAIIAGLCQVAMYNGTTAAIVASGLALFILGLELCEPLAQEIDQGERTDAYPKIRGVMYLSLLTSTGAICFPVVGIMVATMGLAEPKMWSVAAICAVPAMLGGLIGAAINIVSGAPDQISSNAQANMMPPEVAGTLSLIKAIWPVVLAVIGSLPMLAVRSALTHGSGTPAAALRVAIAVLLLSFMIGGWVRFRDDIKKSLANAAAESRGQKSRTGAKS
jgi:3-mercaptopyruvate sulfurtransferase SseA